MDRAPRFLKTSQRALVPIIKQYYVKFIGSKLMHSLRSLLRFAGYFLLALFMFLALARFIDFPVSMFVVGGRSMEPTLLVGDLVFSFKGDYTVGDIVVVEGANRVNCIVHRVVNVTEKYVTTKGDANPGPDSPIDKNNVLYKVVFVVPRLLWLPPVLAVSLFLGYRYWRSLRVVGVWMTFVTIVLSFSILNIVFMTSMPIFHVHQSIPLNKPSIHLKSITLSNDFRFFRATYTDIQILNFLRINWTRISAADREFTPEHAFMEGDTFIVSIPMEVYEVLYANSTSETSSFWVYCSIVFDKATLYGYYPVTFSWRRMDVNVVNGTMVVFNPNPIPINASFEIQYFDLDRHVRTDMFDVVIRPVSNFTVKPDRIGVTSYVILRYILLNKSIVESRKVVMFGD